MYHRVGVVFTVLVIVSSLLLAACTMPPATTPGSGESEAPAGSTTEKPESYKVGFANHLTGDGAVYGQSALKGVELAVEEINSQGGINGIPIELVVEDDRMDAATAQTALLKLVQADKVPVIVGPASSTVSLSLCPKLEEWNVVDLTISSAPGVRDCGPNLFSVFPNDLAQGPEWAKLAEHLGATEVALMYINNDYGNGVKDQFIKAFEAQGGKILIVQPFEVGAKDFRTEVLKVRELNPEFVFIVDHTAEGSIVIKQARELGMETQWVTDVSMQSPEVIALAGDAIEGAIALRAGSALTPEYAAFAERFQAKYGEQPTVWSDFHYDAMMLAAKAIEKGGYTTEGIRDALTEVSRDYVGPSGAKAFDEYGVSMGVYDWMIVQDGKWEVYQAAGQ